MIARRLSTASRDINLGPLVRNYRLRRGLSSLSASGPFGILFLGRDEFSVLVLNELHKHSDVWKYICVATHPDEMIGRNRSKVSVSPLKLRSLELALDTCLIPQRRADFKDWLPPARFLCSPPPSNHLLVTASFGRMIPSGVLHLFPESRRLNVHPSLLPLYRGPAPIQHTIADGRRETGVCVLEMKEKTFGADVGDIWAKKSLPVPERPSYSDLRDILGVAGGRLLVSVLRDMIAGTATPTPQDDSMATRAPFITQETASIDFHTWNAHKIERMYRAIGHQEPLITHLPSSKKLQLHSPRPYETVTPTTELPKPLQALRSPGDATYDPTTRMLAVRCAGDTFVYVPTVRQQDKRLLPASEWWKGVWPQWLNNKVLKLGHET